MYLKCHYKVYQSLRDIREKENLQNKTRTKVQHLHTKKEKSSDNSYKNRHIWWWGFELSKFHVSQVLDFFFILVVILVLLSLSLSLSDMFPLFYRDFSLHN